MGHYRFVAGRRSYAVLFAPSMSDLVREKGQLSVPDGYTSSRAAEILKEASGGVSGKPCIRLRSSSINPMG